MTSIDVKSDLTVIGGGIAGISASLAAARRGLKVALVEARDVLGGNNSSEYRVHLSSPALSSPSFYARDGGISDELKLTVFHHNPRYNTKDDYHLTDMALFSVVLAEPNIDLYLGAAVTEVETDGNGPFGPARSALAESKRAAESIVRAYKDEYQVDGKIARIFNTYGTGADLNDQRVITKMIVEALSNRNLTIYGNGEQLRSFCWVGDVVDGLIRLMNRLPDVKVPVVNIGNNHEISIRALAEKIIDMTGSRSRIIHRSARNDDPRHKSPDISRAREMLGWQPTTTLDEGLQRVISYVENELTQMRSWVEVH